MIYGLDSAYAPSQMQAARCFELGWRFWGVYIGGPRVYGKWAGVDIATVAAVGFAILPIYVGRTAPYDAPDAFNFDQGVADGDDAVACLAAAGLTGLIALDAEYGDWQANHQGFTDYVRGFAQQVNAAGHKVCLYSDMETLDQFDSTLVDLKWGAAYQRNAASPTPPYGRWNPSSPPPWDAWQYCDNGYLGGVSVDLNSARDDFPFAEQAA